jgi:hypothetical protein
MVGLVMFGASLPGMLARNAAPKKAMDPPEPLVRVRYLIEAGADVLHCFMRSRFG